MALKQLNNNMKYKLQSQIYTRNVYHSEKLFSYIFFAHSSTFMSNFVINYSHCKSKSVTMM